MRYHYFTLEQRGRLEQAIRAAGGGRPVDQALERLRTPDYGVCEACEADIPFVRLIADPLARRCAACEARE